MKIALAQLNYRIGDFEANTSRIIDTIRTAEQNGADLVVFAELSLCGYPPLDFLDYKHFVDRCITSMYEIAKQCTSIAAIVGGPSVNPDLKGKYLFNSAWVLADGKVKDVVQKTLLPTYDVFDEYRWFESNRTFNCVELNGVRIALTVCEDLWNMDEDPLYTFWPMDELILQKPDIMVNIAASPFNYRHKEDRQEILKKNVRQYKLPLIYVNQVGAHTDIIFDGGSLVYAANGELKHESAYFEEEISYCTFESGKIAVEEVHGKDVSVKTDRLRMALVTGMRDYFSKMGFRKAVLGCSGGIDSALVLALASEALGKENVHAVLMPSGYSSGHSITDSEKLVANIGCSHEILRITPVYDAFLKTLESDFAGLPFNVAEENIQARVRGTLLMALSNKLGYILLNTSNKSELAVGYGTLYGDMCGGLSVIGDLYKTEVVALSRHMNRNGEVIPENIITKEPSAELRPDQKDSDSLPAYEILDRILYAYIEEMKGPEQIIAEGNEAAIVHRILRMVNNNEWKRFQFAPILRVSRKAFGRGRRMPLVAKFID